MDINQLKASIKPTGATTEATTPEIATPAPIQAKTTEKKYQHYAYSKAATQLITPKGKKFSFVSHQLITDDPEIIEYLDAEIANGLKVITKGALLTSKESDPMRAVKALGVKEYLEEQAKLAMNNALGVKEDMGSTDTGKSKPFSPMSTTELTNAGIDASVVAGASSSAT